MLDMMKYDDEGITGQVNRMWDKRSKTKEEQKKERRGVRVCV